MLLEFILSLLLLVLLYTSLSKPKGLPPGPWGYPVVGVLPSTGPALSEFFNKLKQEHGDVCSARVGSRVIVVVSDYQTIKTAFSNPALSARPNFFTLRMSCFFENLGLAFSEGQVWQNGRRFAIRHLRDFGMGKSRLEGTIQREVSELLDHLDSTVGKTNELARNLNVAILNVIWNLVADKRYDINDPELIYFANLIQANFDAIQGPMILLDFMPWLITFLPEIVKRKWMKVDKVQEHMDTVYAFLKKVIEEHRSTLDPLHPRDYIDAYIVEAQAQKDNPNSTFRLDYKDLLVSLGDLFVAGSETTSSTLRWIILYMAKHPHVQRRVQEEMDAVVPRDALPALEHRDRLPYLDATICEVQRRVSLAPFGIFHTAGEDTTLAGYTIPKGTVVAGFQQSCHYNKKYFARPDDFYPEHFIDEHGKFISDKDGFLPFALGRRQCLGMSLAKMELYLFTAAILHRYTITPPPGVTLSTDGDKTQPLFNFPLPFSVVFNRRPTK